MIQKYTQPANYPGRNNESYLPYCLTSEYQERVSKIQAANNDDRHKGKKTGVHDETNRCKD